LGVRIYADECVDGRVVAGLRRREVDVVSAADVGLFGAADEMHLERASTERRAVVTADHDFFTLIRARIEAAIGFPGLIFIRPGTSVGAAVRAITAIAPTLTNAQVEGTVI
jgi:predicted nuclease of predicted toxin-antitoxin system